MKCASTPSGAMFPIIFAAPRTAAYQKEQMSKLSKGKMNMESMI